MISILQSTRLLCLTCILLYTFIVPSILSTAFASSLSRNDPSGAARPHHLPFALPLITRDTHVNSELHSDSLLHSSNFDTSNEQKSIFHVIAHDERMTEFAEWMEQAMVEGRGRDGADVEVESEFEVSLTKSNLWTIFVPTNDAVKRFMEKEEKAEKKQKKRDEKNEKKSSSSSSLKRTYTRTLMRHIIPQQSYIIFPSSSHLPTLDRIELQAMNGRVLVCQDGSSACKGVNSTAQEVVLLQSQVVLPNRLTGNGVIHLIDRVLGHELPLMDAAQPTLLIDTHASSSHIVTQWRPPSRHSSHDAPKPRHAKASLPPPSKLRRGAKEQLRNGLSKNESDATSEDDTSSSSSASDNHSHHRRHRSEENSNWREDDHGGHHSSVDDVDSLVSPLRVQVASDTNEAADPLANKNDQPPPRDAEEDTDDEDNEPKDEDINSPVIDPLSSSTSSTDTKTSSWIYVSLAAGVLVALLLIFLSPRCCPVFYTRVKNRCCRRKGEGEVDFEAIEKNGDTTNEVTKPLMRGESYQSRG